MRNAQGAIVAQRTSALVAAGEEQVTWVELAPSSCQGLEVIDVGGPEFNGGTLAVLSGGAPVLTITAGDVQAGVRRGSRSGVEASLGEAAASSGLALWWSMSEGMLRVANGSVGAGALTVMDAAGRVVHQASIVLGDQAQAIELGYLAPGGYVAMFGQQGQHRAIRFVHTKWPGRRCNKGYCLAWWAMP